VRLIVEYLGEPWFFLWLVYRLQSVYIV
jgi:hypothetical protein